MADARRCTHGLYSALPTLQTTVTITAIATAAATATTAQSTATQQ